MARTAEIQRKTNETEISVRIDLDGAGDFTIDTGVPFFDHMLSQFSKHGRFDLSVKAKGDVEIDFHHLVEDVGIALGQAFRQALGDKKGIARFADASLPMDETLVQASVDISGRSFLVYDLKPTAPKVGGFDTELGREFFQAFVSNSAINLHLRQTSGFNAHHILEAGFKACSVALRKAVRVEAGRDDVPSTKGSL